MCRIFSKSAALLLSVLFISNVVAASLPDFTQLVEAASPSVVKITTKTQVSPQRSAREDEILRYFFGEVPNKPPQPKKQQGLGSGFIISDDGYILTNAHVAGNADAIMVRLTDGRDFKAELIGADEESDVALLKIDAQDLPALKMGNPEQLKVGAWVLAIGSPFGFDYSVTAGIVSAKGRSLPGSERFVPFIQTDVAINPGNSGGPLFNLQGEVIGINSQIYSRSGGFMGLSFAIPIDVALNVSEQLKVGGEVRRGWLGVQLDPSFNQDSDIARAMGADNSFGALISMVAPKSPAAAAGLLAGDIILQLDAKTVKSVSTLQQMIGARIPGKKVKLAVLRAGKKINLTVVLGDLENRSLVADSQADTQSLINDLGIKIRNKTPADDSMYAQQQGVIVTEISEQSLVGKKIQVGDLIRSIFSEDIQNVRQFKQLFEDNRQQKYMPVHLARDQQAYFVVIAL